MHSVDYRDPAGYTRRVLLPDDAPDSEAALGVPLGPPDLEPLGLPIALERRLHAELVNRGLWTYNDVLKHNGALFAAWQAALGVDASRLMSLYAGDGTVT
jgi:hypothetical protein